MYIRRSIKSLFSTHKQIYKMGIGELVNLLIGQLYFILFLLFIIALLIIFL